MNNNTKYLEASEGNKSGTRLMVIIGICGAFLLTILVIVSGLFLQEETEVVPVATAAGALFTTVISPFLLLFGHNKRQEVKQNLEGGKS
jgi:predicted tellurium resistance membrane protein TerC